MSKCVVLPWISQLVGGRARPRTQVFWLLDQLFFFHETFEIAHLMFAQFGKIYTCPWSSELQERFSLPHFSSLECCLEAQRPGLAHSAGSPPRTKYANRFQIPCGLCLSLRAKARVLADPWGYETTGVVTQKAERSLPKRSQEEFREVTESILEQDSGQSISNLGAALDFGIRI